MEITRLIVKRARNRIGLIGNVTLFQIYDGMGFYCVRGLVRCARMVVGCVRGVVRCARVIVGCVHHLIGCVEPYFGRNNGFNQSGFFSFTEIRVCCVREVICCVWEVVRCAGSRVGCVHHLVGCVEPYFGRKLMILTNQISSP